MLVTRIVTDTISRNSLSHRWTSVRPNASYRTSVTAARPANSTNAKAIVRSISGPWTFSEHTYGTARCLIDRDGRVIKKCHQALTVPYTP